MGKSGRYTLEKFLAVLIDDQLHLISVSRQKTSFNFLCLQYSGNDLLTLASGLVTEMNDILL